MNMSRKGKITFANRCSHCLAIGHNKSSCPVEGFIRVFAVQISGPRPRKLLYMVTKGDVGLLYEDVKSALELSSNTYGMSLSDRRVIRHGKFIGRLAIKRTLIKIK